MKDSKFVVFEQEFELIDSDDWNRYNFLSDRVIPGNLHFKESFVEHFKLINNKLMSKNESLIIRP